MKANDFLRVSMMLLGMYRRERSSRQQRHDYQQTRLRTICLAASRLPYYDGLFKTHQITPDTCTMGDLQEMPILTRDLLRDRFPMHLFQQPNRRHVTFRYTSGSTGTPLSVATSRDDHLWSAAIARYTYAKAGLRPRDALCFVFLDPEQLNSNTVMRKIGFGRQFTLDLRKDPAGILDQLVALKPQGLYSFPSYLSLLGTNLLDQGRTLPSLRFVMTHGEPLTAEVRRLLKRALAPVVRDVYATAETGRIAYECGFETMHVIPDAAILEVVDPDAQGFGDVLVTSMARSTLPLIRYRLGDRLKLSEADCACGVPFQTIQRIEGRANDFLTLPSGRRISWRSVVRLRDVPGILEYQIIQRTPAHFDVLVQKSSAFTEEGATRICDSIRDGCYGEKVDVTIVFRENLSRGQTGKLRAVISEVAVDGARDQ